MTRVFVLFWLFKFVFY